MFETESHKTMKYEQFSFGLYQMENFTNLNSFEILTYDTSLFNNYKVYLLISFLIVFFFVVFFSYNLSLNKSVFFIFKNALTYIRFQRFIICVISMFILFYVLLKLIDFNILLNLFSLRCHDGAGGSESSFFGKLFGMCRAVVEKVVNFFYTSNETVMPQTAPAETAPAETAPAETARTRIFLPGTRRGISAIRYARNIFFQPFTFPANSPSVLQAYKNPEWRVTEKVDMDFWRIDSAALALILGNPSVNETVYKHDLIYSAVSKLNRVYFNRLMINDYDQYKALIIAVVENNVKIKARKLFPFLHESTCFNTKLHLKYYSEGVIHKLSSFINQEHIYSKEIFSKKNVNRPAIDHAYMDRFTIVRERIEVLKAIEFRNAILEYLMYFHGNNYIKSFNSEDIQSAEVEAVEKVGELIKRQIKKKYDFLGTFILNLSDLKIDQYERFLKRCTEVIFETNSQFFIGEALKIKSLILENPKSLVWDENYKSGENGFAVRTLERRLKLDILKDWGYRIPWEKTSYEASKIKEPRCVSWIDKVNKNMFLPREHRNCLTFPERQYVHFLYLTDKFGDNHSFKKFNADMAELQLETNTDPKFFEQIVNKSKYYDDRNDLIHSEHALSIDEDTMKIIKFEAKEIYDKYKKEVILVGIQD